MDFPQPAGSTNVFRMQLNGKPIAGGVDRAHFRLLNKPILARNTQGTGMSWVDGDNWRVSYAPDFKILESEKAGSSYFPGVSAYRLVLDVTDLVARRREHAAVGTSRGGDAAAALLPRRAAHRWTWSLTSWRSSLLPAAGGRGSSAGRDVPGRPADGAAAGYRRGEQGGHAGDGRRAHHGPPGPAAASGLAFLVRREGSNVLSADGPPAGQPEWKVTPSHSGGEYHVDATARDYRLERRISLAGDHLEVADRLNNLTGADIGLAFDNRIVGPPGRLPIAWLGGNPDPSVSTVDRLENSSVFVADGQNGCGLLAVDDVYRIQGVFYYDQRAAPTLRSRSVPTPATRCDGTSTRS